MGHTTRVFYCVRESLHRSNQPQEQLCGFVRSVFRIFRACLVVGVYGYAIDWYVIVCYYDSCG